MASELTRLYGIDNAKKIMTENKNLWTGKDSVAYSLGKRSLKFFALYYLDKLYRGEDKATLSDSHFELWDITSNMFYNNSHTRQNNLLPRGFGKTSMISVPVAIWSNLYGYSKFTVIGSSIQSTAMSFIMTIKDGLTDNDRILDTWGELVNPMLINTAESIELSNNSMIVAKSSRSSFRGINYKGTRINLLILDDYISEDNVTNQEAMDKHYNTFIRNALPSVEKGKHWLIANGTTQKLGDFYNRLEKDPTWKTYKKSAILVDDVDEIFGYGKWKEFQDILFNHADKDSLTTAKEFYYSNMESMQYDRIWDYFDCLELALNYFSNPEGFLQEYQLNLDSMGLKKFTNIHRIPESNIMECGTSEGVLVVDPAGNRTKGKGDFYAFVYGAYDEEGFIYARKSLIDRFNFESYIDKVIELLETYEDISTVIIEKQTYNGSDVIAIKERMSRHEQLKGREINFINRHQSKNKENKINSITGDVNLGKVFFNDSDVEPLEQLESFVSTTISAHDDYPDVLAEFVIYMKEQSIQSNKVKVFSSDRLF